MLKEINTFRVKGKIDKKICLISDIHYYKNYNVKIFDKILQNVKEENPDYICIAGDIIDIPNLYGKDLDPLIAFLRKLASIKKVIASLGNHDLVIERNFFYNEEYINRLREIPNFHLLINEEYIIDNIRFIGFKDNIDVSHNEVGYDDIVIKDYNSLFKNLKIDNNYYNVLLAHNPIYLVHDSVIKGITKIEDISLILSGHTHGGLCPNFLFGHRGLISPNKKFFPKDIRGMFNKKNTTIIISSGVVKLSTCSGMFRHFNFLFPFNINYIKISKKDMD